MATNNGTDSDDLDLGFDLTITETERRTCGLGMWVSGTLHGHGFQALVFPGHATNPEHEIGDSRISKLWVQRLADKTQVYNWDRGADQQPADTIAAAIVDFLCAGLAESTFGH